MRSSMLGLEKMQDDVAHNEDGDGVMVGASPSLTHSRHRLPVADFRSAAQLFLQHLWTEAHGVLLVTLRLMAEEKRRMGGGAVPPVVAAMRRHLEGASKYALLGAIHLARCRCIRPCRLKTYGLVPAAAAMAAVRLRPPPPPATTRRRAQAPTVSGNDVGPTMGSVSTFLITFFQGKACGGAAAIPSLLDDEELLNAALRILPGCYCVEAEDAPFVGLVFPSLLVPMDDDDDAEDICMCRHEWSRGVLPMLAVAMVIEQFAGMRYEGNRRALCWRKWKSATRHRRTASWVGSTTAMGFDGDVNVEGVEATPADVVVDSAQVGSSSPVASPQQQPRPPLPPLHPTTAVGPPPAPQGTQHNDPSPMLQPCHDVDVPPAEPLARQSLPPSPLPLRPPVIDGAQLQPCMAPRLVKAFAGWKSVVLDPYARERCRTQERLTAASVHAMRQRRMHLSIHRASRMKLQRAVFERWRDVFVPQTKALRWWRWAQDRACRHRVWSRWRDALHVRQAAQREAEATAKLHLLLDVKDAEATQRLFGQWRLAMHVQQFQRGTVVARCFTQWRSLYAFSVRWDHLLLSAAQVQSRRCAVAAVQRWKRVWHDRVAQRWCTQKLLRLWRHRADKQRHEAEAACHLVEARRARCMQHVLRRWFDVWDKQVPLLREETCIIVQWQQARLLAQWKRRCTTRRHRRVLLLEAVGGMQHALVQRLWARWKQRAHLHACARTLRDTSRRIRLRASLDRWHRRKWLIDSLRDEAEHRADVFASVCRLRSCLGKWRRHWIHRLMCHQDRQEAAQNGIAAHTHRVATLRRCFQQWVGAWAALRRLHRTHPTTLPTNFDRHDVSLAQRNDDAVSAQAPRLRAASYHNNNDLSGMDPTHQQHQRPSSTMVYVHRQARGSLGVTPSQAPPLALARSHLLASVVGHVGCGIPFGLGVPTDDGGSRPDEDDAFLPRPPSPIVVRPPWRPLREAARWDGEGPYHFEGPPSSVLHQRSHRHTSHGDVDDDDGVGSERGAMYASVEIVMECDDASSSEFERE